MSTELLEAAEALVAELERGERATDFDTRHGRASTGPHYLPELKALKAAIRPERQRRCDIERDFDFFRAKHGREPDMTEATLMACQRFEREHGHG